MCISANPPIRGQQVDASDQRGIQEGTSAGLVLGEKALLNFSLQNKYAAVCLFFIIVL